jgi:SDR family mycofactocin-dependent oxidoreductase
VTGVAIVTGAARGIGAATVHGLAAVGWTVVAVDVCRDDPRLGYPLGTREELETVVREAAVAGAAAAGAGVHAVVADATDPAGMAAVVADAERGHGGLDAFVAAAGGMAGGAPQWELPPDQERAVLEHCLGSVLVGARVAVPALLRRPVPRSGRFLAVASAAATRGLPLLAAYCAAKAGVAGLIRALGTELADSGVTANAVSPGSTDTPMLEETARLYDLKGGAAAFAVQQPQRRLLEPEEVAAMLVWLAGPASSGLTGAVIPVDGGLSL